MNVENYFHIALLRPAPVTVPPLSQCSSHATRVMSKSRAPKCEQEQNIFPHQAFVTQLPLSCVSQRSCNQCACSVVMYQAYPKLVSSNQNDEKSQAPKCDCGQAKHIVVPQLKTQVSNQHAFILQPSCSQCNIGKWKILV